MSNGYYRYYESPENAVIQDTTREDGFQCIIMREEEKNRGVSM